MPTITFKKIEINVVKGANLRRVLLENNLSPYNAKAQYLNCRGLGTCGTCAVKVKGEVSAMTAVEQWRLNFPPHNKESGLRLACQCKVLGDCALVKHEGFWGQKANGSIICFSLIFILFILL